MYTRRKRSVMTERQGHNHAAAARRASTLEALPSRRRLPVVSFNLIVLPDSPPPLQPASVQCPPSSAFGTSPTLCPPVPSGASPSSSPLPLPPLPLPTPPRARASVRRSPSSRSATAPLASSSTPRFGPLRSSPSSSSRPRI